MSQTASSEPRKAFPRISPSAWEHADDRSALATLRQLPGIDAMLQQLMGATSETAFRLIHLASAVRVSERQFPHVHAQLHEACRILDAPAIPEVYVAQQPFFSAGTMGIERPFIVLHAASLDTLTPEEMLCIIGRELAHCLSGNATYKTLLQVVRKLSIAAFQIPLGGTALLAMLPALMEWNRKSELSADRAGLLVCQDPTVPYGLLMKMAGGPQATQMDVNEFFTQAAEYDSASNMLERAHKFLNLLFVSHPFPVIRLTELQNWVNSGAYARILANQYDSRDHATRPTDVFDQVKAASESYRSQVEQSKDMFTDLFSEVLKGMEVWGQQAREGLGSMFDMGSPPPSQPSTPPPSATASAPGNESAVNDHEELVDMLEKLQDLRDRRDFDRGRIRRSKSEAFTTILTPWGGLI